MARRRQAANQDGGCAIVAIVGVLALLLSKCSGASTSQDYAIEPGVESTTQYAASPTGVNCRSAPSPTADKVTAFSNGAALSITAEDDGWAKVDRSGDDCWVATRLLSSSEIVAIPEPVRTYEAPRSQPRWQSAASFSCGSKRTCGEMNSCAEANHYLNSCGRSRLDGDGDGVPCESIC